VKPRVPGRLGVTATQTPDNTIVVKAVAPGGAAEKGGLKAGDVILRAGDKDVRTFDDLAAVLEKLSAGDALNLKIKRGTEEKDIVITLAEASIAEGLAP
jgi:S1-C subfamily serine protease